MYTLEDTKNMSRALRHDDFDGFSALLKTDERFTPWLNDYQSKNYTKILFNWIDAEFVTSPANDVESVFISALADSFYDDENWVLAYACLTCLHDSSKAQKKRAQAFENYTKSAPSCSIENAFHEAALEYYKTETELDENVRNDARIYHELARANFEITQLREAMKGRVVEGREVKTHLDAIAALLFAVDKGNWEAIKIAAERLAHPLSADDAFHWMAWFADCATKASEQEMTIILAWSDCFWPLIRDPFYLRERVRALYPDAAEILETREDLDTLQDLHDDKDDVLPQTAILRAMLADDSRMVTQHADIIETLHPVISALLAAWLNLMDEPTQLAQTIRASLKQSPTMLNLYAMAFTHELIPMNEKAALARELLPLGDNALCLLGLFRPLVNKAFESAQRAYIVGCQPGDEVGASSTQNKQAPSTPSTRADADNKPDSRPSDNTIASVKSTASTAPAPKKINPTIIIILLIVIAAIIFAVVKFA